MNEPLSIALVSPHAWPAYDEVTWRIEAEARALAARGHGVTVLTPVRGAELLSRGRRILAELRAGNAAVAEAEPGEVRVVPLGRAIPAGPRRRIGGPLDLSAALEDVLSRVAFDVVHVHEPLAPTPALAALRHARGVTAATVHRVEQVAGVAFVRPLVDRAVGRVDRWFATTETARRAVREMFDRDATVLPAGADTERFGAAPPAGDPPDLVIVGGAPDRTGTRFGAGLLRVVDTEAFGEITLLGPADAPWRTRAAIPKALRPRVRAVADDGPGARAGIFRAGAIAVIASPDDLAGSAPIEAMAAGMALIAPRCAASDALITHGADGLVLPPFSRAESSEAIMRLARDPDARAAMSLAARRTAADRDWDGVAAALEAAYRDAAAVLPAASGESDRLIADLRVHSGPDLAPREVVDACRARGIGAVALIGDGDVVAGLDAVRMAPAELRVVVGQQIHTAQGDIVGLFLAASVADGLTLEETVAAIRAQDGVVMAPHPVWGVTPTPQAIRALDGGVDCVEALSGPASLMRAQLSIEDARLMQAFGLRTCAGSGATRPEQIGSAHVRMPAFDDAHGFLRALDDAEPVQQRRGLRPASGRERRRPADGKA